MWRQIYFHKRWKACQNYLQNEEDEEHKRRSKKQNKRTPNTKLKALNDEKVFVEKELKLGTYTDLRYSNNGAEALSISVSCPSFFLNEIEKEIPQVQFRTKSRSRVLVIILFKDERDFENYRPHHPTSQNCKKKNNTLVDSSLFFFFLPSFSLYAAVLYSIFFFFFSL